MSDADELVAQAACCATAGPEDIDDAVTAVRAALERGRTAAAHGRVVPLPVLLDVWTILGTDRRRSEDWKPDGGGGPPASTSYDRWLTDLCADVRAHRPKRPWRNATARPVATRHLPEVLAAWPPDQVADGASPRWAGAFSAIAGDDAAVDRVRRAWCGTRATDQRAWAWCPDPLEPVAVTEEVRLMGRMAELTGMTALHEGFDHAAARMFLEAADAPVLADQSRRIDRLRRRASLSLPLVTSLEELDPVHGAPTIAVLCQGDYGIWKLVNGSHTKIASPASALPIWPVDLHLCWTSGVAGLAAGPADPTPAGGDALGPAESSTLQGLVALLVDDWRWALRSLPVRFHAHRAAPVPTDFLGGGGRRWKAHGREVSVLPPAPAVGRLFQRRRWTELGAGPAWWTDGGRPTGPPARAPRPGAGWWCMCLLECDLGELGFEPAVPVGLMATDDHALVAPGSSLPHDVSHALILAGPLGQGRIFRVSREPGDRVRLRPARVHRASATTADPSYRLLRTQALDIVLEVLESAAA